MKHRLIHALLGASLLGIVFAAGCRPKQAGPSASVSVPIPVSHPVEREVTDYVDFTGRTDAVQSVSIRARVTGYLEEMPFQEVWVKWPRETRCSRSKLRGRTRRNITRR